MDTIQSSEMSLDSIQRTNAVRLHISRTIIYRAISIGANFLLVSLTIRYLDSELYGLWLTLLSCMSWIAFFDIGLGNGLRNRLTEALAVNNTMVARIYVTTTYAAIGFIAFLLFVCLLFVSPHINWTRIFNIDSMSNAYLLKVVVSTSFFFLLNFILSLGNSMYYAYQEASLVSLRQAVLNVLALIVTYILVQKTSGSLLYLCVGYGIALSLSNLFLTIYFFSRHAEVIPSLKYVDFSRITQVVSLGTKFFIIQMAVLVIFTTDNMIITQVLGPEQVTPYNIVLKLFSIITLGHGILLAPLWSAHTDAYAKRDLAWIRGVLRKLNLMMIPVLIGVLVLLLFADIIIRIWIGPNFQPSHQLIILMATHTVISVWNNNFGTILSGIGKLRLGAIYTIATGLINIPLSVYFAHRMGVSGVILGTILSVSVSAIISPLQVWYFIFSNKESPVLERILS